MLTKRIEYSGGGGGGGEGRSRRIGENVHFFSRYIEYICMSYILIIFPIIIRRILM